MIPFQLTQKKKKTCKTFSRIPNTVNYEECVVCWFSQQLAANKLCRHAGFRSAAYQRPSKWGGETPQRNGKLYLWMRKINPMIVWKMGAWSDGQFFALCVKNHHFTARQPKVRLSIRAPWCSAEMGWTLTRHKCEKSFWFKESEGRDSGRLKLSYQISVNNRNVRESNPKLYIVEWYCWLVV